MDGFEGSRWEVSLPWFRLCHSILVSVDSDRCRRA